MAKIHSPFDLPIYSETNKTQILHPLTDTHCHLDYLKTESLDELIKRAQSHGVKRMLTISVSPGNHQQVLEIARTYDNIFCTQGIHPHQAKESSVLAMQAIKANLKDEKVVAVGEIGLDFHYNLSDRDVQLQVFEEHLQLAVDLDLPVVIHSREADQETKAMLQNFNGKVRGVIHSFTSSIDLARFALDQGLYLGFNGIITFKNAQNVRDALIITPIDRILIETDSPFLAPVPLRGTENTPANIPWVAAHALSIKQMNPLSFLEQVEKNAQTLFGLNPIC